jgi:hypothetical protein
MNVKMPEKKTASVVEARMKSNDMNLAEMRFVPRRVHVAQRKLQCFQ